MTLQKRAQFLNTYIHPGNSWLYLGAGLGLAVMTWLWLAFLGETAGAARGVLLFAGLVAAVAGTAVQTASWKAWGTASLTGLIAMGSIDPTWDSARLLMLVLAGIAAFIALLVALPVSLRRLAISLVILVHFGGIATAVMTVPPTPWLANVLWSHFYRYYLEFMYLTNAYHFYSPEPGPATLLWAYVEYDDGTGRWFETPRRADHPLAVEYQRRLSVTESINQLANPNPQLIQEIKYRRLLAGQAQGIPVHPTLADVAQYREPTPYSKHMLATYARYIARNTPHATDPERQATGVKMYRVIHCILNPDELAAGREPDDPTGYLAYFQGDFTALGELKDPTDPLLYWLIPILKATDDAENVVDYVRLQAEHRNRE
jgi:hypothetical protein